MPALLTPVGMAMLLSEVIPKMSSGAAGLDIVAAGITAGSPRLPLAGVAGAGLLSHRSTSHDASKVSRAIAGVRPLRKRSSVPRTVAGSGPASRRKNRPSGAACPELSRTASAGTPRRSADVVTPSALASAEVHGQDTGGTPLQLGEAPEPGSAEQEGKHPAPSLPAPYRPQRCLNHKRGSAATRDTTGPCTLE
jgi:hypothetical protein